jgi:hypothetical protein
MNASYGSTGSPRFRASFSFLLLGFWLSPLLLHAAQQDAPAAQEPLVDEQQAPNALPAMPTETHATQQAPQELLSMASHEPENFIGKLLVLDDGASVITVGPVKDLRKREQDQQLYLIVDATAYFNSAVDYAVAVKDVDRIEDDKLIIPEAPGMHLRGLDYYPDDYSDIKVPSTEPAEINEGD